MPKGLERSNLAGEKDSRPRHRAVIIGVGAVARCIAQAIAEIPRVSLVAGSCRTRAKGEAFAGEFSCQWYEDTQAMLAREQPDFAIIATPSGAHLEPAQLCARQGIHVLCEKPLEITLARSRQIVQACADNHVTLGAIFPQRFNPVNRLLRDAAVAGRFGRIACISATMPWWREDAYYAPERWQGSLALDGGGALINQAIHTVDLLQWIVGAGMSGLLPHENPVEVVFARMGVRGHDNLEVEDTACVILRFRDGTVGQLQAATSMYPGSLRRLILGGRDGTAEVLEDQLVQYHFRTPMDTDEQTRLQFAAGTTHAGGSGNPMAIVSNYHRANIESFLQAMETRATPEVSGIEAAKAIAIIEAAYESARHGVSVKPRVVNPVRAPESVVPDA